MDDQEIEEYELKPNADLEKKCNCLIESLLKRSFNSLPFNEKEIIIKSPKPTCELDIISSSKTSRRHFKGKVYERVQWLCGCAHLSKLFCWPCLLFSKESNVWNKFGFDNIPNLSQSHKRHECSQSHIYATIQFKRFGKENRIHDVLSAQFKANIESYNMEVTANRYIISKLINAICFISKQELSFPDKYVELLYFLSESDSLLKYHLDNSNVFKGISNEIQNDLISSISKVLLDEIQAEIRLSKFISIIIDETTDITNKAQLSTVIRYVDENDVIQERFVGFNDASPDRTADSLFEHIYSSLVKFGCTKKLIAQTYDGAVIISGEHNRVQKKIRDICPKAIFVHCYTHRLTLVLSQTLRYVNGCKLFMKYLLSFSSFFGKSSRRASLLDCEIRKRFPLTEPMQWNHDSRILKMVYEFRSELIIIFDQIIKDKDQWDSDAVIHAEVLGSYLQDLEFNFCLNLFSCIFNSADILFDILQKKPFEISYCSSEIKKFVLFLNNKREDFDSLWDKVSMLNLPRGKCKYNDNIENLKLGYKTRYFEILETISTNITERFKDIDDLKFMGLLNVTKFKEYDKHFPESLFISLQSSYGTYFNIMRLKSELIYIYSSPEYHLKSIICINNMIVKNELKDILTQVFKLIKLILTIPTTSASVESSLSTVKRIKTFTRNNQSENNFSELALISIEKQRLDKLMNDNVLYDLVIEDFCKKEHGIKLIFKKY